MVTFAEVREWDPEPLRTASGELQKCGEGFRRLADELFSTAVPEGWRGNAAGQATAKCERITDAWEDKAAVASALDRGLFETSLAVEGLRSAVEEADELARRHDFAITADGQVTSPMVMTAGALPEDITRERDRIRSELIDRVKAILRRAEDIDNDVCVLTDRVLSGELDSGEATSIASAMDIGTTQGAMPILPPPRGASPADNASWWATLSAAERSIMLNDHPKLLGNMNGLPAQVRDEANRARIPIERERLEQELRQADGDARAKIRAKLESLDAIERTLDKPDRHLLTLDMSHDLAEAAIANGNVDKADHVAVFTPGFTSTVNGSLDRYDQNLNDVKLQTERILDKAAPEATVATVTWLGYQAPQKDHSILVPDSSVLFDEAATKGAGDLAGFLNGIDASRPTDPHLTALGHSYGSLTTGLALQEGTGADDAVIFGSPGVGTGQTEELKMPDGHVLSLEANSDLVADVGRTGHLGEDPTSMPGMRHGETGAVPERSLGGVSGHSGYFTPHSTSLYNMSATVAGENQLVIEGNNVDVGDIEGGILREAAHTAWEAMPWNWG